MTKSLSSLLPIRWVSRLTIPSLPSFLSRLNMKSSRRIGVLHENEELKPNTELAALLVQHDEVIKSIFLPPWSTLGAHCELWKIHVIKWCFEKSDHEMQASRISWRAYFENTLNRFEPFIHGWGEWIDNHKANERYQFSTDKLDVQVSKEKINRILKVKRALLQMSRLTRICFLSLKRWHVYEFKRFSLCFPWTISRP